MGFFFFEIKQLMIEKLILGWNCSSSWRLEKYIKYLRRNHKDSNLVNHTAYVGLNI